MSFICFSKDFSAKNAEHVLFIFHFLWMQKWDKDIDILDENDVILEDIKRTHDSFDKNKNPQIKISNSFFVDDEKIVQSFNSFQNCFIPRDYEGMHVFITQICNFCSPPLQITKDSIDFLNNGQFIEEVVQIILELDKQFQITAIKLVIPLIRYEEFAQIFVMQNFHQFLFDTLQEVDYSENPTHFFIILDFITKLSSYVGAVGHIFDIHIIDFLMSIIDSDCDIELVAKILHFFSILYQSLLQSDESITKTILLFNKILDVFEKCSQVENSRSLEITIESCCKIFLETVKCRKLWTTFIIKKAYIPLCESLKYLPSKALIDAIQTLNFVFDFPDERDEYKEAKVEIANQFYDLDFLIPLLQSGNMFGIEISILFINYCFTFNTEDDIILNTTSASIPSLILDKNHNIKGYLYKYILSIALKAFERSTSIGQKMIWFNDEVIETAIEEYFESDDTTCDSQSQFCEREKNKQLLQYVFEYSTKGSSIYNLLAPYIIKSEE